MRENSVSVRRTPEVERIVAKLENDARNELHSVMGMLELIAQAPLTQAQSDYLRACKASTDRLLRSVQNVSAFLAPDTEKAQISGFDLYELVADSATLMEALAQRKGLALTHEIRPDVPRQVAGDRDRLQDVLIRLLDNAIRFTSCGRIQLAVSPAQQSFPELGVQFDVCDTGPGIPAEVVEHLSKPLTEYKAWQGLGLPIVRSLVLSMGGDLSFRSQEAGGARVTVSLPFRTAASAANGAEEVAAGGTPALNILVVEDSDDSYYVLEGFLREDKHHLTRATTGTLAVELFKNGQYDLVLMYVHMPDMDGYSATRAIRTWETGCARARVPIVVLSSDSPATQVRNGAKVGCSSYLTKPVSKAALSSLLKRFGSDGLNTKHTN